MSYYCGGCFQECAVAVVELGLGRVEFWGAVSNDTNEDLESWCCSEKVYDDKECEHPASCSEHTQNEYDAKCDHAYDEMKDRRMERD